jgi:hypothetical protein
MAARNRPKSQRQGCACGCLAVVACIVLVVMLNLRNPSLGIPSPKMPNPNARDFLIKASGLALNGTLLPSTAPLPPLKTRLKSADLDAPARAMMKQGLAYPYMEPPLRSFNTLLPHFAGLRNLARSVAFDSEAYAAAGQWDRSAEMDLDDVQMGEMIPHGSTLIGKLVGIACSAIGRRPLWTAVDHVSAHEARSAAQRLAEMERLDVSYPDTLREEKWAMVAGLQEVFNTRQTGSMVSALSGSNSSSSVNFAIGLYVAVVGKGRILHTVMRFMDEQADWAALPYSPTRKPPDPPTDPISQILYPVFDGGLHKVLLNQMENRLLMTAFALRAYRLEQGKYPAALSDLVAAGYLPAVPQDLFAPGKPLSYRLEGAKYVLYSAGPDGVDNGGTAIYDPKRVNPGGTKRAAYTVYQDSKGDIVAGVNE